MGMSIPYEQQGRRRQKARTRAVLLQAARELLGEGITPTVEQAAERAEVARTTAYRYFRNQKALLLATYPELEESSLLGPDAPADPSSRLEMVTKKFTKQLLAHEAELRASLRLALDPHTVSAEGLPLRQGRGIQWIDDALIPLRGRVPDTELRRLVLAIRTAMGIEALVWLTDIAGLSRSEAVATMRWSAQTLLQGALVPMGLSTNDA